MNEDEKSENEPKNDKNSFKLEKSLLFFAENGWECFKDFNNGKKKLVEILVLLWLVKL